jgi:hypothetical protein
MHGENFLFKLFKQHLVFSLQLAANLRQSNTKLFNESIHLEEPANWPVAWQDLQLAREGVQHKHSNKAELSFWCRCGLFAGRGGQDAPDLPEHKEID